MVRIAHDVTFRIEPGMLVFPGDGAPRVRRLSTAGAGGASLTASEVTLGCHVGTHVDAPAHFLRDGATVEDLPLRCYFGPAVVVTREEAASRRLETGRHILVKTGEDMYGGLAPGVIERLLEMQPLSIGCDAYCLDADGTDVCARAVALRGLPAFVRLDLRGVEPGEYWFSALPWKVAGVEGSPVRAVLLA